MTTRRLNPRKLLLSKWTALHPQHKEKHFIVSKLLIPEGDLAQTFELIELEAIYSKRVRIIAWRELLECTVWQQGWH